MFQLHSEKAYQPTISRILIDHPCMQRGGELESPALEYAMSTAANILTTRGGRRRENTLLSRRTRDRRPRGG